MRMKMKMGAKGANEMGVDEWSHLEMGMAERRGTFLFSATLVTRGSKWTNEMGPTRRRSRSEAG